MSSKRNNHFRAFDTLWEILHVLDRQDLYHLYRVVDDYYEHIPPTGLGLMLLGDLNIIWETAESSDDDFWKDQEEWEIIRWRFHESSGVHTLEIEDGTMIHMLAERRYPLSRELMIRMLEHGMEVEDESEIAITLIHLFILWTTANGTKNDSPRVNGYVVKAQSNPFTIMLKIHVAEKNNCFEVKKGIFEGKISGTTLKEQDTSSRSGNDAHADDANIRPYNDEEQNGRDIQLLKSIIFATGQQHTKQTEFNNEGEVDQNAKQCHDTCPLPAKLTDNQKTKLLNQSLKSENIHLKKTVA
ncbi:hypothetical protein Tco_1045631 [Tanacetum coccineum]|uniref:Uncharacterized protein n=1 Tax=Tanacetum coccineum TaxID=301880 RepID=A0ABQ5GTD0_9ASTR